jgi:hypothetical protein
MEWIEEEEESENYERLIFQGYSQNEVFSAPYPHRPPGHYSDFPSTL